MAKIDKYNYLLDKVRSYDYKDKDTNMMNYVGYTLNRSLIMFKYHNMPDTLPQSELESLLQTNGFACVAEVDGSIYAFNGGLGGEPDVYGNPTTVIVSNPALKLNQTFTIGKDCVLVKNDSLIMGLLPLYYRYASMLVENDITMVMSTVNKRVQNLLCANDDKSYESALAFIQKIFDGELAVIGETKLLESIRNLANSTLNGVKMQELVEFEQYTKASLYNEIGLSANYNMKRERLTKGEVEANTDNLYPLVDNMYDCRKEAVEAINSMFNLDIQVEFNSSWDYRLYNGVPIHNIADEVSTDETLESVEESEADGTLEAGTEQQEDAETQEANTSSNEDIETQEETKQQEDEESSSSDENIETQEAGAEQKEDTETEEQQEETEEQEAEETEEQQEEKTEQTEEQEAEETQEDTEQQEDETEQQEESSSSDEEQEEKKEDDKK